MLSKTLVNPILVLAILLGLGVGAAHGAPAAQEDMTYTVKRGDYLWALAKKYLGDGHAYRDIVAATNAKHDGDPSFAQIVNPDLILPGWKLLIPGVVAAPTAKALDTELASQLQAALDAAVESPDTQWPGAVLHVSSDEIGIWTGAAGLGNTETNTPMRPHDRFRAGSLTKPMISVVILQLVEEGHFSLDAPIMAVLPESITGKFAHSDQITVRMLLNHTAGLPDFMDLAGPEIVADPGKVWEAEEFLDFAAEQEPWFAPGEAQGYSNTDYTLLGMVIEEATGRSWREEMRERIFEPLNLENTLLPEPDDTTIPGDHARGYADFGGGLVDATEMVNASVVGAPGGQSLVTTPEDLARFMTAALAGELFQKAATLEEMLTFVDWPDGNPLSPYLTGYGLGLMQAAFGSGIEGVGHSGDTQGGYHAFVFHLPAQDMTISGAVNAYDYEAGFARLIPRALEVLVPGFTMPEPEVGSTPPITDAEGNVISGSIASLERVTLGGIEQWILIRGVDTTKPLWLWLHGGPGTPEMPWVGMFQPPELEADFVVVQWDQRGTGKSYSKDLSEEDMRVENFVSDTLELTDVLRERFGQEKIFLLGHSWGSALGFMTIMENSEPYYAYIAAAEAADWNRRQTMSYEWVLAQAREHNDTEVVQVLESVQPFDPMNMEHITAKNQFLDRYRGGDLYTEGLWDAALDYVLSGKSPEYTSADIEQTLAGMDFSRQTVGVEAAQSGYSLFREFPVSPIPVHFFAGRHDHQTPGELAEEYYNFLEAPAKSFTWFENSGHTMIWDEPDKTAQELIRIANETLNP
jgi:CubicO group peptidase (beta-lactamase class C family)